LLPIIDQLGVQATGYFDGAPSLDLTDKAYADVPWLKAAA
jgi:hypothetical protein